MLAHVRTCFVAITALAMLPLAAADARSLDEIISSGTIKIGVNPNFPPMSAYGATNEFEGFDIDIGNRIAEALGVEAEFVPTETPQRVPFITAGTIDISLGALTRTAERAKLIDYTVPLHTEAMAVLTTDAVKAESWKDLNSKDITLVNIRGTWTVDFNKEKEDEISEDQGPRPGGGLCRHGIGRCGAGRHAQYRRQQSGREHRPEFRRAGRRQRGEP